MKTLFTRLRHKLWPYDSAVLPQRAAQGGFLLLSLLAVMVVLSAAFLGLSQYQEQNRRWQTYYAFGQQLALTAQALHAGVQIEAFAPTNATKRADVLAELMARPVNKKFTDGPMGDHFWNYAARGVITGLSVNPITAKNYGLDYRDPAALHVAHFEVYAGLAPIGAPDADLAPSAYLIVRMKPVAGYGILAQRGRDLAATRAGAVSKGLSAFAVVNYNPPSTQQNLPCPGGAAAARWSGDDYGCLTASDLVGFNDGDIVIATWQSQPKNLAANDVIYRYPQPGNPSLNRMATNLGLGGHNIAKAGEIQTSKLVATADATIGEDANSQALTVQGTANLQGHMQVANNILVANKLTVSGDLVLTNDTRVGDSINVGNGNGIVRAQNVSANTLGEDARDLVLQGPDSGGAPTATKVTIDNDAHATAIWVSNSLNAAKAGTTVSAASLTTGTLDTTILVADSANANGPLTMSNLSVLQSASLPSATATGKCSGQACPDQAENPGGGL